MLGSPAKWQPGDYCHAYSLEIHPQFLAVIVIPAWGIWAWGEEHNVYAVDCNTNTIFRSEMDSFFA